MIRHFLITVSLTLGLIAVGLSLFYELVMICKVLDISAFWSVIPMVAFFIAFTCRPVKKIILRFNR